MDFLKPEKPKLEAEKIKPVLAKPGAAKPDLPNPEKFKDPEGITLKKLAFSLWFVSHRRQMVNLFKYFLMAIAALTWSYTIYGTFYYIFFGMKQDRKLAEEIILSGNIPHETILKIKPKELVFFTPQILSLQGGRYDFMVQITNPNWRHWGRFKYYFLAGDRQLAAGEDFILPEESKYIVTLGQEMDSRPGSVQFVLGEVDWSSIDNRVIKDWETYRAQRHTFPVEGVKFTPGALTDFSASVELNNLEFTAVNATAYNYWAVDFTILLYQRGTIAGVNRYAVNEFLSDTRRPVNLSWPGKIGRVDKVEIFPSVNILDQTNYIRPGAREK